MNAAIAKWLLVSVLIAGGAVVGGPVHPDGSEVDCDLPVERHQKNMPGRDGAGLCVFTAIGMAADWANVEALIDFRDYMTQFAGGGYPQRVTEFIRRLSRERHVEEPAYLQIQSNDLELLVKAVWSGRMPAVTYSRSPTGRYGGMRIAHMVNLVAARVGPGRLWAVLDNNYPGTIEWMSEAEFAASYGGLGEGWAVVLMEAGPPAAPRN